MRPTLVRQEDAWGCMIAAIAMVLGRSYTETKALLHPWFFTREQEFRGIGQTEMDSLLTEHGFAVARRFEHYHPACCHRTAWPPQPWGEIHIAEVATSMSHAVVMLADGRVLDPALGARASLSEYSRVFSVTAITRIRDSVPEFVSPITSNRKRPTVCTCQAAWENQV